MESMTDDAKPKPLTRAQRKLVDASVLMFGEGAAKKLAAIGFPPCTHPITHKFKKSNKISYISHRSYY